MNEETALAQRSAPSLYQFVESDRFKRAIVALIFVSSVLLGVETVRSLPASVLDAIFTINRAILAVFVVEVVLRIAAHRLAFFRDPWSIFDFAIVVAALLSPSGPLQVLRALRILRALRLVSTISSLRRVVDGLLSAVPGIGAVMVLLLLVMYIAAVMSTLLFRDVAPENFGHLGISLFSLFQIMTLEGWSDIATRIMAEQSWAWIFFIFYILVATVLVLNLVIGVVVSAIQSRIEADELDPMNRDPELRQALTDLREDVAKIREVLDRR
ncbi:MAG TPA: ion transporter [Gammaproteobacteria bacterium]